VNEAGALAHKVSAVDKKAEASTEREEKEHGTRVAKQGMDEEKENEDEKEAKTKHDAARDEDSGEGGNAARKHGDE
jgi:hypothetical protein